MKSMTGFGTGQAADGGIVARAEVKSVNHRYLDFSLRMPHVLGPWEEQIRRTVKEHLNRGHVEMDVTCTIDSPGAETAFVNTTRVASYVAAADAIAEQTGLPSDLTVSQILQLDDVLSFKMSERESDAAGQLALEAVRLACENLVDSRQREGAALWADVRKRIGLLRAIADRITEREPVVVAEYAERMSSRIRDLLRGSSVPVDPQRLAQEVAFFADRASITEELIRIRSHLDRLEKAGSGKGPQGRNMDFIAQELNREFNTIGSKSQDCALSTEVLAAKTEVERIREQVQNIE